MGHNVQTQPSIGSQKFSTVMEKTFVVAAKPATLLSATVTNKNTTTDYWLLFFDAAAAPTAGDAPKFQVRAPRDSTIAYDVPFKGESYGVVVALSTDPHQYTAISANDGWFSTRHI